jgi:hypothetical protein
MSSDFYRNTRTWSHGVITTWTESSLAFPFHLPIKLYMYWMNLNYALVVKQDLDKLLVIRFIEPLDQFTWLSPIVVIPNMNIELKICIDFCKLNLATILILFHLLKSIGCNGMPWNLLLIGWIFRLSSHHDYPWKHV